MKNAFVRAALPWVAALPLATLAIAQEAVVRKNLADRLPELKKIDEVAKTPIAGLFEVRVGNEIFYADEQGNYLIQGTILDTRTRTDLTQVRINKLTAFDFAALPLKDAIVWKQGSGARKLVVFADPNCGYCRRLEKDLSNVKDVAVYTFLYPILGGDSPDKVRDIWCAKDPSQDVARLDARKQEPAAQHGPMRHLGSRAHRRAGSQTSRDGHADVGVREWYPDQRCADGRRDGEATDRGGG